MGDVTRAEVEQHHADHRTLIEVARNVWTGPIHHDGACLVRCVSVDKPRPTPRELDELVPKHTYWQRQDGGVDLVTSCRWFEGDVMYVDFTTFWRAHRSQGYGIVDAERLVATRRRLPEAPAWVKLRQ